MLQEEVWILAADRCMAEALELQRWVQIFAEHGVALVPKLASELWLEAEANGLRLRDANGRAVDPPRLCIARVYERYLPAALELMGARCLVNSRMIQLAYDKALVTPYIAAAGIPMIPSLVLPELTSEAVAELARTARNGLHPYPFVLKPARGRGGSGVVLVRSEGELFYEADRLIGQASIVQPLVDPGRDLRVYVIGGKPRYAMERIGATGDFRSNYSTGGTARAHRLTPHECELAERVLAALPEPLEFGSVDFCFEQGELLFCEINANLGCRIPYEFGKLDLIGDYAEWIREEVLA